MLWYGYVPLFLKVSQMHVYRACGVDAVFVLFVCVCVLKNGCKIETNKGGYSDVQWLI